MYVRGDSKQAVGSRWTFLQGERGSGWMASHVCWSVCQFELCCNLLPCPISKKNDPCVLSSEKGLTRGTEIDKALFAPFAPTSMSFYK